MSRNYKIRNQDKVYFVTFTTINWIDVFIRMEYRDLIVESVRYCQANKGLEVYAWCIMSSHVHLMIGSHGDKIEHIVRDMKRHTSKAILAAIASNQQESRRAWMLWMFERAGKKKSQ